MMPGKVVLLSYVLLGLGREVCYAPNSCFFTCKCALLCMSLWVPSQFILLLRLRLLLLRCRSRVLAVAADDETHMSIRKDVLVRRPCPTGDDDPHFTWRQPQRVARAQSHGEKIACALCSGSGPSAGGRHESRLSTTRIEGEAEKTTYVRT